MRFYVSTGTVCRPQVHKKIELMYRSGPSSSLESAGFPPDGATSAPAALLAYHRKHPIKLQIDRFIFLVSM